MNNLTYTVVTLDRKETPNVSLETIKEWYSKRLLHEDSLLQSPITGHWQTLEKTFNLSEFPPRIAFRQPSNSNTPAGNFSPNQQFPAFSSPQYQPAYQASQSPSYQTQSRSSSTGKIVAFVGIAVFLVIGVVIYLAVPTVLKIASGVNADRKFLAELNKIEVPGKVFIDPESGAKLAIPDGWRFIKPQNKILDVPDARILAVDKLGNKSAMLEVVTIPSTSELPANILETGIAPIEDLLRSGSKSYSTLSISGIPFKDGLGKKLVYERVPKPSGNEQGSIFQNNTPIKGQFILTVRGNRIYIFQTWCVKETFNEALAEFTQLENNLIIPPAPTKF